MKEEKSCGTIIIYENKVLIIKQNGGKFGFPKGHMDDMETEVQTALRETKEETNVDVIIRSNKKYEVSYKIGNHIHKTVTYFLAIPKEPFIIKKQEEEIEDIFWVPMDQVEEILSYDNIRELWKNILEDIQLFI